MPTDQYLEVYVSGLRDNIDVCHVLHVLCVLYTGVPPVCVWVKDFAREPGEEVSNR